MVWFDLGVAVSLISPRLLFSVTVFWTFVYDNVEEVPTSARRIAPKNHSLSRTIGPPRVASCVNCSSSRRGAALVHEATVTAVSHFSNGVVTVHDGLEKFVRQLPLKLLPPDLVMAFTTPPVKRPYSAVMPEVRICVSS